MIPAAFNLNMHLTRIIFIGILAACSWAGASAQETTERHAEVKSALQRMGEAVRDSERDSIGDGLKDALHAMLESDGAMQADLSDIPISRVDAPDGKFRLITFNVPYTNGTHRYEGLLLVDQGKRRVVYDLKDRTASTPNPWAKKLGPDNWYGALYYTVIPPQKKKGGYYTLLGWKGHSNVETRKVIDVLSFKGGVPVFGAPLFKEGKIRPMRKIYAYGFHNSMSVKHDPANKAIVLDHLAPSKPEFDGQPAFMGPDLSFDAYVWHKGAWHYLRDVDVRNMNITGPSKPPPAPPR